MLSLAITRRLTLLLSAFFAVATFAQSTVTNYHYQVIEEFPHPVSFFTQGLEFYNGMLYQSSGQFGESFVQIRPLNTNKATKSAQLDKRYFGEGITILEGNVYQLTWRSLKGFIYDAEHLSLKGHFTIDTEGWGITNNGQQLIYSDGTNVLRFLNPQSLLVEKSLHVTFDGKPLSKLNELEWVDGLIYANVWQSNWIVMINPDNGNVVSKVRLNNLLPQSLRHRKTDVLNGIAYDDKTKRLFVTGKYWPRLYHIELLPPPKSNNAVH